VAFLSTETSLTANSDGLAHIYLRDTSTSAIQLVDVGTNGVSPISVIMTSFRLSADGSVVAFECQDGALSINPHKQDAFLRDLGANTTEVVSVPAATLASVTPLNSSLIMAATVSSNGQLVAFTSTADGMVSGDTNGCMDVFVHDFVSGSNTLVSVSASGPYSGNSGSYDPAISANGRYVTFTSSATNLLANDNNNCSDIFLRDLQTGLTTLVSTDATGSGEGNGNSCTSQISADGAHVLFFSRAMNLTTNSVLIGTNIFWRDIQAGVTYAVTTNGGATNGVAAMTADGSNVLFAVGTQLSLWNAQTHSATNVASGSAFIFEAAISANAQWAALETLTGCYAVNLAAGTNWLLKAVAPTSQKHCQFSGNGQFLAYLGEDSNGTNQVYVYDFQKATNTLVSQSYNSPAGGNSGSDSPTIDAAGRFIAYRSAATNLVPGGANGLPDIFLYDRLTGGTTLVSVSLFGPRAANGRSLTPFFSADGGTLLFESWASDLAPGDFNESSDVFALTLPGSGSVSSTNSGSLLAITGISWATVTGQYSPSQPLMLTWPSVPGTGYQVQFTKSLTDPQWQPLSGPATIVGNQGQIIDCSPDATQRFYRIVSY
jgi:hypothetical protein